MAWDVNATIMQGQNLSASGTGPWTRINDLMPSTGQMGPQWTPRAGTMLLNTGGYGFSRQGIIEFVFWLRGVTFTGAPTNVNLTLDVEEADDAIGTNVNVVCRFVLGKTSATLNYVRTDTVTPAVPAATQYAQVGIIKRQFIRWNATITITAGTAPTVTYANCDLRLRGTYADIEVRPPAE